MTLSVISGFQASNIGQYGIDDFSFGSYSRPLFGEWTAAPGDVFAAPGATAQSPFFDNPILDAMGQIAAAWFEPRSNVTPAVLSEVLSQLPGAQTSISVDASVGPTAVVPQEAYIPETSVINPGYDTEGTVFEEPLFEEGNEWFARTGETDWERVYDEYVILNQPEVPPVWDWLEGATTVGQLGTAVGWWGGDSPLPPADQYRPVPGAVGMPETVTINTRTGKVTKCKRRRRRKLLTESDFNVLLRVATLPNKENVRIVLGKAIGRSG